MIRKLPAWLRVLALSLAFTLAAETTGAAAALVAVTLCSSCCEHARAADDCGAKDCTIMCGVTCCVLMQESEVAMNFAASRGPWVTVEQSGSTRPVKPPVPPPRV